MKKHFWIYILILIVVVLVVLFWRWPVESPVKVEQPQRAVLPNKAPAVNVKTTANQRAPDVAPSSSAVPKQVTAKEMRTPEGFQRYVDSQNKPIEFYGRFIDQYSNPVPDVKVKMGTRHWTMPDTTVLLVGTKDISYERTSDADGRFEVSGGTGDGLGIFVNEKDGYILSPQAPRGFGPKAGSYDNPVIIKMWKLSEKEPLASGSKFWGVTPDSQVYTIDFLKQSKMESSNAPGDIRISVTRPAQIKPHAKFDWSFTIEGIHGGIIESKDEFMYLAPEDGYQTNYKFIMSSTNANWRRELSGQQFFLKSRDGQVYGRFAFDLIPDYNNASIFNVSFWMNPNGSRNLQP